MKFSVSAAFLLVFSQAVSIASAASTLDNGNQQCSTNNGVSTKTVTVTASEAVTKTVTVNAGATSTDTSTSSGTSAGNNNNSGKNSGQNNNGGTNNVGNNNGGNGVSGSQSSAASTSTSTSTSKNNVKNNSETANLGNSSGGKNNGGSNNQQDSLQLDPSVIGPNLAKDGLVSGSEAGQVASKTSKNNFINNCVGKTITNGMQVTGGSCNSVPMGDIPSKNNMPACKFTSPSNFGQVEANSPFDVTMEITGMQTGTFVNPNTNYFAAPQQLNKQGQIIGHSHFVIQKINSIQDTTVPDPQQFFFFQGLNAPAVNNKLTVSITKGLPEGTYRIASINTAGNHQPALVPVAQHGSLDDMIYLTVSANRAAVAGSAKQANNATSNAAGAGTAKQANNATSNAADAGTAKQANNTTSNAAGAGVAKQANSATSNAAGAGTAKQANNTTSTLSTTSAKNAQSTSIAKSSSATTSSNAATTATNTNVTSNTKNSTGNRGRMARRFSSVRIA